MVSPTCWGELNPKIMLSLMTDVVIFSSLTGHLTGQFLKTLLYFFDHYCVSIRANFSTCCIIWQRLVHIQASLLTWLYDYDMQLESLRGVTGPGVDRGRQPVQQLAHMVSVELHHWVQALHLTQGLYTLQCLRERGRNKVERKYVSTF